MIGVYWETWSDWKSDLASVPKDVDIVYLAFADPNGSYGNRYNFSGTGISASKSFNWYQQQISSIKSRGGKVMLSVGGGTYPFPENYNSATVVQLANDLGCDGLDIDWENGGVSKDYLFSYLIKNFRNSINNLGGSAKYLSCAGWSTGCMLPVPGDTYKGMNIKGIVEAGSLLDWINIMTYDCGPPSSIDPKSCFWTYRVYYKGPLYLGFEPGQQSWGGYVISMDDVIDSTNYVVSDGKNNGVFIWSYQKDVGSSPTVDSIVQTCKRILSRDSPLPAPQPPASGSTCTCPVCGSKLSLNKV